MNDPFFLPAGAEAFRRDNASAKVVFYDTGHFALETHAAEIGAEIRGFLTARGVNGSLNHAQDLNRLKSLLEK